MIGARTASRLRCGARSVSSSSTQAAAPISLGPVPPGIERSEQLRVAGLTVHFMAQGRLTLGRKPSVIRAVDGVDFVQYRGETLGLVGESGCGKSTTGRAILRLQAPTAGTVTFDGTDVTALNGRAMRRMRRKMQIVFQDPYASLDPRMNVGRIIGEPLEVHGLAKGRQKTERIRKLMDVVGLSPRYAARYPHEFSGGQRQRIGIARALAVNPEFIVLDEPMSALDVSVQAQIVNLLEDLQDEFRLTYLFIAHDLAIVRHISDRVAVMYLGKIVEVAERDSLYERPLHPYTQALLSAVPVPDPISEATRERIILRGDVPSPANVPSGCRFRTRCFLREELGDPEICRTTEPALVEQSLGQFAACHFATPRHSDAIPPSSTTAS